MTHIQQTELSHSTCVGFIRYCASWICQYCGWTKLTGLAWVFFGACRRRNFLYLFQICHYIGSMGSWMKIGSSIPRAWCYIGMLLFSPEQLSLQFHLNSRNTHCNSVWFVWGDQFLLVIALSCEKIVVEMKYLIYAASRSIKLIIVKNVLPLVSLIIGWLNIGSIVCW